MAFNVFELFAKLGLDTSEYEKGLEGAERTGSNFGTSLRKGLGVAAGITTAAITATTAATVAGTKAFVDGVSSVAEYGDNIDKMSQKMNLSATAYQEWDFIMQHAGTSIESMQAGIKTLSTAAESGKDAFDRLGISQEQIAEMSGEELFGATITALQGVESETERTYLAGQLLGRGATELGALLNMSAEETEAMRQQVHELGGVLSDDAVKDAAQFQDSLQNMQTSFAGMRNSMLTDFLPSFSTVMDGLALVFSGDSDSGLGMIESGVNDLADNIAEVAPRFIQIGGTILTALATSLTENLPVLLESGAEAVSEIATGIITNLPEIIPSLISLVETVGGTLLDHSDEILQAGSEVLVLLVNGIAEHSDEIIPIIVSLIDTVVNTLYTPEVLGKLLEGGLKIIGGLIEGLAEATPDILAMIPDIISNMIGIVIEVAPEFGETILGLIGSLGELILGLVGSIMGLSEEEISESWDAFVDWCGDMFDNLLGDIGDFGADVIDSFFSTFEDAKDVVSDAIDALIDMFDFDWSLPQIKLPHFSITGGEAPWGFAGQGSFPSVSIKWYKKAMDAPYLLDSATIFGAAGGNYLGGGEAGTEMIYGHDRLMDDIGAVVEAKLSKMEFVIPVYIGGKKIEQQVVSMLAHNNVIAGGR